MENEVKLNELVMKFFEDGKLNNEYKKDFDIFHAFTKYKLEIVKYFINQLNEIEESGITREVPDNAIDKVSMCWDCADYMLVGAYDGLLCEIYHILGFDFPKDNTKIFDNLMHMLAKNTDDNVIREIQNAINQAKKDWEGKLYDERNGWTHRKLPIYRNASWKIGKRITFTGAFQEGEKYENLLEKLKRYYNNMSGLIDNIYGLLIKKLEE